MLRTEDGVKMAARVEKFEDLIAGQKAGDRTRAVDRVSRKVPFARDFDRCRQIRRASASIMWKIAEGFDRGGRAAFQQFLSMARASCAEVRSQVYVAVDAGYGGEAAFRSLLQSVQEVGRIVGGLRSAVERQRRDRGNAK